MKSFAAALTAVALAGCATWSTSSVDTTRADIPAASQASQPSRILVTDTDVVDRRYQSLGDITVTVNKTTIFHPDPTPTMVNDKLRQKASEMGADAVILVRYGSTGMSLWSYGSLEGKGRAIKFTP